MPRPAWSLVITTIATSSGTLPVAQTGTTRPAAPPQDWTLSPARGSCRATGIRVISPGLAAQRPGQPGHAEPAFAGRPGQRPPSAGSAVSVERWELWRIMALDCVSRRSTQAKGP